jgi:PAS domain-containing protein
VLSAGDTLFRARVMVPTAAGVRLRIVERARLAGAACAAAWYLCIVAALWRRGGSLRQRLLTLALAVAAIGVAPLNALSNATQLFDASFYFASLGGPYTASVGALGFTAAVALVALFALLRSRVRGPRWLAGLGALAVIVTAPSLLRALSRGISLPAWGVTAQLWLAWEVTIFLAAAAVLLAGASLGRAALGRLRGAPPWLAPVLAGVAATLGPVLWQAPGRWPRGYVLIWVAAIAALALARRHRRVVLAAAVVAGCGAATVVWGSVSRKRVELATRDVAALGVPDAYARALLERLADDLLTDATPSSRSALLTRYAGSDLAAAGYTAALVRWSAAGERGDSLVLAPQSASDADQRLAVAQARAAPPEPDSDGGWVVRDALGPTGAQLVLAAAHRDGTATTVTVGARTRLGTDEPAAALLGLTRPAAAEPPYTLALVGGGEAALDPRAPSRWKRLGDELHGDWAVRTSGGPVRAHVEVDLRSTTALLQRGALVVLLDLLVVLALWTLTALAEGGHRRWLARRWHAWARSYRARLTVALFAFFVVPAALFVTWSYRRLQTDDRQARELLVGEALRSAAVQGTAPREFAEPGADLTAASEQVRVPLLLYADGVLEGGSDPLYEQLATLGHFLAPSVRLTLGRDEEVTASRESRVGALPVLMGYRAVGARSGERLVLAAPARLNETALDRRRRDLGTLVLLATAMGALAALWLSGVAARELARPINALREAALAIAGGAREATLGAVEPPSEFEPVFGAYRRMAADLSASQALLEAAQRRTEAVLRNVASGVLAVDASGHVLLANPRAEAICGSEVRAGAPLDCVGAAAVLSRVPEFVRGDADEEEFDAEVDGRQLHARLTRLSSGGAVLTLDDVTELARAQRVLAWGEMARQVAHEIKNPLTPIRLGVQHLRRARNDGRSDFDRILDQNVTRILAEIDRLDEIARAFSRYGARPRSGARASRWTWRAWCATWWPSSGSARAAPRGRRRARRARTGARARRRAARGAAQRARERPARERAARARGGRVRRRGGPRARARRRRRHPADALPRVFEPHFSTRTSGSGLGLAISRRLIEGWGGSMRVESEAGRGTTLTIVLPRA